MLRLLLMLTLAVAVAVVGLGKGWCEGGVGVVYNACMYNARLGLGT